MDLEAGSSSAQPPPGPSSNSLEVNALRRRLASLELQLSQATSGLVPLPVQYAIMPGAKVPADRPRPEVAPAIFAAMRDSGMLPRAMPLHLLVISDNIEERRKVNALAREQNERPHAVCSLRVHEAMDVDQAVSLIRSGVICHIVFFCIDASQSDASLRQGVDRLRLGLGLGDIVPIVAVLETHLPVAAVGSLERIDVSLVQQVLRGGAHAVMVKPIGIEALANAWQHCLRRDPMLFERSSADARARSVQAGRGSPIAGPPPSREELEQLREQLRARQTGSVFPAAASAPSGALSRTPHRSPLLGGVGVGPAPADESPLLPPRQRRPSPTYDDEDNDGAACKQQ